MKFPRNAKEISKALRDDDALEMIEMYKDDRYLLNKGRLHEPIYRNKLKVKSGIPIEWNTYKK